MIRRPPRSTQSRSSAASDVYKRQTELRRPQAGEESGVALLERHDKLAREWNDRRAAATLAAEAAARKTADEQARANLAYFRTAADDFRESATRQLGYIRAEMRRRGMVLP